MKFTAYTDGACSGNPGPGGWGFYWVQDGNFDDGVEFYGSAKETTNNKMELTAAIEAIKQFIKSNGDHLEIFSDSEYVVKGLNERIEKWIEKGWRTASKDPVKNKEHWEELYKLFKENNVSVDWVRGHNGQAGNEIADELACKGRDEAKD